MQPACGALGRPDRAGDRPQAYFVGKPNPLMTDRPPQARRPLGEAFMSATGWTPTSSPASRRECGRSSSILSGSSSRETIEAYPYRPTYVYENVGEIPVESLPESRPFCPERDP